MIRKILTFSTLAASIAASAHAANPCLDLATRPTAAVLKSQQVADAYAYIDRVAENSHLAIKMERRFRKHDVLYQFSGKPKESSKAEKCTSSLQNSAARS